MTGDQKPFVFKKRFPHEKGELIEFLSAETKLSRSLIKKLLANGAVWLKKGDKGKRLRVRRATMELLKGSLVELFFDPKFLDLKMTDPKVIRDEKNWGVWYKPASVLSQGNDYGDHLSIERFVEKVKGEAYLLHRLDREAHGLMIFAYNQKTARILSEKFQKRTVKKFYEVEVLGDLLSEQPASGDIEFELDGKEAKTSYKVLEVLKELDENGVEVTSTRVEVELHTGRLHQIRRHFALLDFPVLGDPKYGKNNKNKTGMKLCATKLEFKDPYTQTWIVVSLNQEKIL